MLELLKHQIGDIEWIDQVGRGLLANEPGLGKSASAIRAFDGGHNLVIAPSLVIEGGTWVDELEKFSDNPNSWTVAPYSILNARKATVGENGGKGSKPVHVLRPEYRGHWDAVVVDEAHYTKGRKTSWTWAVEEIGKSADNVLEMTGTPIPNWAHEMWTLLRVIRPHEAHPGKPLGSFWRWAAEWFDTSPTRFSNGNPVVGEMLACTPQCLERPSWDPCSHYHSFVRANLGPKFRRMLRDDCLDLPPMTRQTVEVPLDATGRKVYRELKKDFISEVDGEEVIAWSQGAKNVMLDKLTTSPWLLNKIGKPKGGKLEMLRYDLESRSRPTLVLAHYRDSVEACTQVARDVGCRTEMVHGGVSDKDKGRHIQAFKNGELDVLVGSLETLAEGLTLTVADMAIFVEMSYKPSRNEQARFRIHRIGQTRPVSIREYVTPATVDAKKRILLDTKTDRQMRVLTAQQFASLL